MTEQQDVTSPTRRRRHGNTILLGTIPVAVALTALLTSGTWASTPDESQLADGAPTGGIAAPAPAPMPSIVAPGTVADAAVVTQKITVTLPPKPVVVAAPAAAASTSSNNSTSTAKKSTGSSTSSSASFQSYCANPQGPYSASGGVQSLLSAANKERARIGIKPLSWSSSLAGSATSWSKTMAAKDSKTSGNADALSHNPNRPGAENVAVSYVSTGLSQSGAVSRAHPNWMYSNGHCLNIMNPAYSTMGAGMAATSDGKTWYTTANFR
ncbi:CAP domain-containing protein [Demequina aurantiaca]|uniref:CAP domain-containing protein n=1 Tax=Demequina aurantiaca TaxID=676200 RepID=UPI003D357B92